MLNFYEFKNRRSRILSLWSLSPCTCPFPLKQRTSLV